MPVLAPTLGFVSTHFSSTNITSIQVHKSIVTMDFENESSYNYSSPSSTSSLTLVSPSHAKAEKATTNTRNKSQKKKTGRKKFKETRHPVYRGVRQRNGNKWVCEIREPNKKSRIWLGTYPTPEMAARVHDVATLALKGTSAVFNFPDSLSLLPVLKSTNSVADFREAASKAAKAFPPPTTNTTTSIDNLRVECKSHEVVVFECDDLDINVKSDVMNNGDESKSMFFDEEVLYNMPGFLDSMAEGLLITPPSMKKALDWDDVVCEIDLTLWKY